MSFLEYRVVDVFTDRPFAGNQLAVVLGGQDLTTSQCQLLAAEFHLSETSFPMVTERAADYRLRIFTPGAELPFAGHPSIGTAWVQRDLGVLPPDVRAVVQDCGAGLLPLEFREDGSIELTGGDPVLDAPVSADLSAGLVAGCGLAVSDLIGPIRLASCGVPYVVIPVRSDAVTGARPGVGLEEAIAATSRHGALVVGWDAASRAAHVRMFAPNVGVLEDPATGSAAVALGAYLVAEGLLPGDGESTFTIRQGGEIGRPSQLFGRVTADHGRASVSRVAGHVAKVAEGRIRVPDA